MKPSPKTTNSLPSLVTTIIHNPQPPKTWPSEHRRPVLRRSALLRLAFIVNSLADSPSETDLPLPAVHAAAQAGRLLELLAQSARRYPDFSFLQSPPGSFDELNSALRPDGQSGSPRSGQLLCCSDSDGSRPARPP